MFKYNEILSTYVSARQYNYIRTLILVLLGTGLITLAAKTQIPFWPVPMTLHSLAIFFIAAMFGLRIGALTVGAYLLEGALGLPVFSGTPERGIGLAYMAGPTGGYLAGFFVSTLLVGYAADKGLRKTTFRLFSVMIGGLAVVYTLGAFWLSHFTGLEKAIQVGVIPFIFADVLKIGIATIFVRVLTGTKGKSA